MPAPAHKPDSKVIVADPAGYPEWDRMLCALEGYSFFHSSPWAALLSRSYQYRPAYFTVFDHGRIAALMPFMDVRSALTGHRGVSLPFSDSCEPLVADGEQFRALFAEILAFGKEAGWKSVQLRGGQNFLGDAPPSATYFEHILPLSTDEDGLRKNLKDTNRRNIKKAVKEGVEVKVLASPESVREFVAQNRVTRRLHGLPPQPCRFFKDMYDGIIAKNLGDVAVAYHGAIPVAANVYFHLGDKVIYKYGASNRRYQHLRASNLVMWEAIRHYAQRGFRSLHLGRTDLSHEGLRRFKLDWGATERTIHYYKYDLRKDAFVAGSAGPGKLSGKIFGRMPLALLDMVGSLLYRHMG